MDLQDGIEVKFQVARERIAMSPSTKKEKVRRGRKEKGKASRRNDDVIISARKR